MMTVTHDARIDGDLQLFDPGKDPGRAKDLGGIGYYYLKSSDDITDAVRKSISLDHEQGGEFFYNIEVLPWLNITPNL